jgi:hypothetical protein
MRLTRACEHRRAILVRPISGTKSGEMREDIPGKNQRCSVRPQATRETDGSSCERRVTRLDRLARSTRDLLNLLGTIGEKEAGFKSLRDTWADTTTAHGRLPYRRASTRRVSACSFTNKDSIRRRPRGGRCFKCSEYLPSSSAALSGSGSTPVWRARQNGTKLGRRKVKPSVEAQSLSGNIKRDYRVFGASGGLMRDARRPAPCDLGFPNPLRAAGSG